MAAAPELPELPKPAIVSSQVDSTMRAMIVRSFTADQMNAHYLKGYEAGSAAAAQAAWRPIAEAPKDGTHFLALLPDSDTCHVICWVDASKGIRSGCGVYGWHVAWDGYPCSGYSTPTHWMPLPNPPAAPTGEQA